MVKRLRPHPEIQTLRARVVELEGLLGRVLDRESEGYISFCGMNTIKDEIKKTLNR